MRTTVPLDKVGQLVEGRHENPFELLGPHEVNDSGRRALAVRAFLPHSTQAWVVDPAHEETPRPMRRILDPLAQVHAFENFERHALVDVAREVLEAEHRVETNGIQIHDFAGMPRVCKALCELPEDRVTERRGIRVCVHGEHLHVAPLERSVHERQQPSDVCFVVRVLPAECASKPILLPADHGKDEGQIDEEHTEKRPRPHEK